MEVAATSSRLIVVHAFWISAGIVALAEIGDKTQLATAMLAARYTPLVAVILGTTSGMLLADVPAVLLGERVTRVLPLSLVRRVATALFVLLGIATLLGGGSMLGL